MTSFDERLEKADPMARRVIEAIGIIQLKAAVANQEIMSFADTEDVADLVAAERALTEMAAEIKNAIMALDREINREDADHISQLAMQGKDQEGPA